MAQQRKTKKSSAQIVENKSDDVIENVPVPESTENQSSSENSSKSILLSKTIWVNVIAVIALFLQNQYGFVLDESLQVEILGIINIILRLITKEPVQWRK